MPKYLIYWNAGFGPEHDVIEAPSDRDAEEEAKERWYNDCDPEYDATLLTHEKCVELCRDNPSLYAKITEKCADDESLSEPALANTCSCGREAFAPWDGDSRCWACSKEAK